MARVRAIRRPSDHPDGANEATSRDLAELFEYLFPQDPDPEIDASHLGIAIAAQSPKLALHLAKLSRLIALELPWCQRADLRELAIQTVNVHLGCDYALRARRSVAEASGVGAELQAEIPSWETSPLFSPEQKLVIEYSIAVSAGRVPGDLFSRVVERYGERGAIECTAVVAFWSFWAMMLNATGAEPPG